MAKPAILNEIQGAEGAARESERNDSERSGSERNESERNESERNESERNDSDWKRAHAALTRFAKVRAGMDWEEGQLLLWTLRSGSYARLGYATFPEYVERFLGYGPRFVLEKVRVAEALEMLPELSLALKDGELHWSALRELTRVAVLETEREWRRVATGRTAREIERLVSGRWPGDRPGDPPDASVRRHVLRFEVSGETLAVFREALARIRRDTAGPLDDDGSLMLMARHVLGGPRDRGRANYQIQVTVCEQCGRGEQLGKGERVPVGAEVVSMCQCDAQQIVKTHMGSELEQSSDTSAPEDSEKSVAAESLAKRMPAGDMPAGDVPADDMPAGHVPADDMPADDMPADDMPADDMPADDMPAGGMHATTTRLRTRRASQTIPPAVRRAVLQRDNGRCVVPGCRNATFLDVHHVQPRHERGRNDVDNLICACAAHHRAIHSGTLMVDGRPSSGLVFRHADGTAYGGAVSPDAAELGSQVFQALTRLGFRETDARRAIAQSLAHMGAAPIQSAGIREELFRNAIELLTPRG